jgi:hypothetical protein
MTTPHMKMAIEELQEEQLRNAAEAKSIYWYPSEFNDVRQWLEGVLLDITLMDRRYVGEVYSRRLRPDIVLAKRVPKYITVEAENPPSGKDEKPGYVYSVDTDGGCTPKKLSYEALAALQTPATPPRNEDGSAASARLLVLVPDGVWIILPRIRRALSCDPPLATDLQHAHDAWAWHLHLHAYACSAVTSRPASRGSSARKGLAPGAAMRRVARYSEYTTRHLDRTP